MKDYKWLKKSLLFLIVIIFSIIIYQFDIISATIATGGNITYVGEYTIHTFISNGTFIVTSGGNVEVLVVAGGGSGGGSTAGGGGAGGLIYNSSYLVNTGSINVTVGSGGAQAASQTSGNNGQNSSFGTLIAIGGGGGGFTSSASGGVGKNGGSGGGGATYGGRSFSNGTGIPGQGNNGGTYGTDTYPGGGGGGAGTVGSAPTATKSGNGGNGSSYSINGSNVYYAGGGGGGSQTSGGTGGLGGGGNGTSNGNAGTAGTNNTGGGGGGGWFYASGTGGAGGSGIIIVRYLTDVTPPNITLNSPENEINTSLTNLDFNFTATDETSTILNCSLYIDNVYKNNNNSVVNGIATLLNASGLTGGNHNWIINCSDASINSNASTRNFYVDISPPNVSNIIYYPNLTDDVDPGTNITFNATVVDNRVSVSSVILQYYNGTDWNNKIMSSSGNDNYNATITTVSSEQNYTFNIWTNDSFGNSNNSVNQSFNSTWDCTWSVSPSSLEEVVGFYEDKFIGNITLINTGDAAYSNNNCSISFTTGYTGFSSTYTSLLADSTNWATGNRAFQYTSPVVVNASSNQTININASFPSTTSPFTETPSITITSSINDSITRNRTVSVASTLIIAPPNPLLYEEITTYPTTYVYLTPGNFSLIAYVRNLGYDDSNAINTTAHNVSFNWTLPSEISSRISEGNETSFYELLNTSSRQYNNLTIGLTSSNLASMSKGIFNITIYSYGYQNNSGNLSLIENSGGYTILNETVSIQFLCYDVIDTICVSACGVGVDPDCKAATTSAGGSAGGGGGGGGAGVKQEKSEENFELLSGEEQEFKLKIENKFSNSKENIKIKVTGINSEYISLNPAEIAIIAPSSYQNITVKITAPAYFTGGKYTLIFEISGDVVTNSSRDKFSENKYVTLTIVEVKREEVESMIKDAEELINKMNSSAMSTRIVLTVLDEMNSYYEALDFLNVKNSYKQLKDIYDSAFKSLEIINDLKNKIKESENKGVSVIETKKILYTAEASYKRGDFALALKNLEQAKLTYALETKGEFNLFYTIKNNPVQTMLVLVMFGAFSAGSSVLIRYRYYRRRLKYLAEEEKLLLELMKVVQRECFEKNKMSMEEYGEAMSQYEDKLGKAVEEKIGVETKMANVLKIKGKRLALNQERLRLVELMKELQDKYLNKATIETRVYENMLKTYSRRLLEVEEQLTFMDAQEAIKSGGFFRGK